MWEGNFHYVGAAQASECLPDWAPAQISVLTLGRFLIPKVFHQDSLIRTMKSIWHTRQGFTVVPLDDPQCMLFSFQNDFNRRKVMRGAPWTFDRSLLILVFTDVSVDPMTVLLEIQHFWVRIRPIPPIFLTSALGENIGIIILADSWRLIKG
ncbi:hypothetical protein PRUPE_7G030300 [Prunus persica]|uniref:DUF4283 domain-containing protein n=1 Tax=Prunus persica TaxID=3760 RepID=A0A251N624_PRUPE|nr:hypothetical protein PRUPE_7G030300 [Prunus persica]